MKGIITFVTLIACAMAQRPSYAGTGPIGRPSLASRFQDTNAESTTLNLNNRLGEDGGTTERIPVDARGDTDLVHRLNQWPRENRPFWLLNADHIEASKNQNSQVLANRNNFENNNSGTIPAKPQSQRSPFLAPINNN